MATCAVVDTTTWKISAIIVANSSDAAPPGSILVGVPDGLDVDTNWEFITGVGFICKNNKALYIITPGAAQQRPLTPARNIVQARVDDEATAWQTVGTNVLAKYTANIPAPSPAQIAAFTSAINTWSTTITTQATALKAEVGALTFAQLLTFKTHNWPPVPTPA